MPVRPLLARTLSPLAIVLICLVTSVHALSNTSSKIAPSTTVQDAAELEAEMRDIAIESLDALIRGSYRSVRRNAGKLQEVPAFKEAGVWLEARAERVGDDPNDALKFLKKHEDVVAKSVRVAFEYGLSQLETGHYEEAQATGESIRALAPSDPRGYWVEGESLWQRGQYDTARIALDQGFRLGGDIRVGESEENFDLAEQLWASGWCSYRLNNLHGTTARFNAANRAFEEHLPSWMGLARVYFETDKYASARQNYAEPALEVNPNLAEAYYWQARSFEYRWRSEDAKQSLDSAIRANRDYTEGLAYRATFYVRTDQYERAEKDIERVLKVNDKHLEGLAAKALIAATLGRQDQFGEIEQDVLGFNPSPGNFYLIVGDGLAARHRFDESIEMYQRGIEAQPDLWTLYRSLGQSQLNSGDDVQGKKNLELALQNDTLRNSVITRNLLLLLNTYEERFVRITEEDEVFGHTPTPGKNRFRLLIPKEELPIMGPLYMRMLTEAMDDLTAKYQGFEPARPLTIEAFHVHADFEVRTVGLEGLPALGACFGKLVTLDSPSARPFGSYNWASTLIHELDHVYQLQMSNGQIPRWLAEGCSVYEERRSRPEWERHMEDQLFQTYASDALPKVTEFNEWFGDGSRVLFAYYLASIMVEFIVENYGGYAPVITMIKEFSKKKTPDEVFATALKIDTDEFDERFKAHVGKKVSKIKLLPAVQVDRMQDLQEMAEDSEASVDQIVTLARAHYQRGNYSDARIWAGLAQKRGADTPELNYTLGFLAQSDPLLETEERGERAYQLLGKALNQGLEDFTIYMWLARYYEQRQSRDDVIFFYNRARDAFPTNPAPLGGLFSFYQREGDLVRAQEIAEQYIMLSESDLQVRQWLLDRYELLQNHEAAADMALQMIYVSPYNAVYYQARGNALRELGQYEEAQYWFTLLKTVFASGLFEKTLQLPPNTDNSRMALNGEVQALLELARTEFRRNQRERGLEYIRDAEALDPDHADVLMLKRETMKRGSSERRVDEY